MKTSTLTKINEVKDNVIKPLMGIDLKQIGKDIMQGLLDGIASMASAIWKKVTDIADGVKNAVTEALGIASPSKVMIGYGKNTGEGLMKGIAGTKDGVLASMGDIVGRLSRQASPRFKSSENTKKAAMKLMDIIKEPKKERLVFVF